MLGLGWLGWKDVLLFFVFFWGGGKLSKMFGMKILEFFDGDIHISF